MNLQEVAKVAVDTWGLEAQMLMVGEEAIELAHAILKWRRAWVKYNKVDAEMDLLERKAIQRSFLKTIKNLKTEAVQVSFMLAQLKIMQPDDYDSLLEDVILDCRQLLENRGVQI